MSTSLFILLENNQAQWAFANPTFQKGCTAHPLRRLALKLHANIEDGKSITVYIEKCACVHVAGFRFTARNSGTLSLSLSLCLSLFSPYLCQHECACLNKAHMSAEGALDRPKSCNLSCTNKLSKVNLVIHACMHDLLINRYTQA